MTTSTDAAIVMLEEVVRVVVTHHFGFPFFFPFAMYYAFATFFWLLDLVLYFVVAGAFFMMFRKAGTENPWLAFIPIAGLWPFMWTINRSAWNILWLLFPVVNWFFMLYWMGQLIKCFGLNPWLVLLSIFPILNLIYLGILLYLGYSRSVRYTGNGPYGKGMTNDFYY